MQRDTQKQAGTVLLTVGAFSAWVMHLAAALPIGAADWPAYMHDNSRSGVTVETLDVANLSRTWAYTSPAPPRTAWSGPSPWDPFRKNTPQPATRDFDSAFFVTVIGDLVFFGSSVTDSVHALDLQSGKMKWAYPTDGAVRFPPSHYDGKIYFGSDDGYLYCVDAATGSDLWKYSPNGQTRLLGNNGSLVPMWPIRTSTAIFEEEGNAKVYFAASLVPWEPPYLCALDAKTGADSGAGLYKRKLVVEGGVAPYSGSTLTPMGAILMSPSNIYLPQGRMVPFIIDRRDGSDVGILSTQGEGFFPWMNNYSGVGTYALLTPDHHLIQGRGRIHSKGDTLFEIDAKTRDVIARYDAAACMIVAQGYAYVIERTFDNDDQGRLIDVHGTLKAIHRKDGKALWSVGELDYNPYVLIKADRTLFVGGAKRIVAYDCTDGRELWHANVKGKVRGIAAANGYLIVSTDLGHIIAFG